MNEQGFFGSTPPKTSFIFGFIAGIALASVFGLVIILTTGGADSVTAKTPPRVAAAPSPAPSPALPPEPRGPVEVPIGNDDHIRGNAKAPVTLLEFSDLQCPFCGRFHPTVQQALKEYGDKVRWVYKHFPLDSIHPYARPLAEASECAAEQGKFWEFVDADFAKQNEIGSAFAEKLASDLKLDMGKFKSCVSSRKYKDRVSEDYSAGLAAGVQGTPHTLVNGIELSGAVPYEQVKALIDAALAK